MSNQTLCAGCTWRVLTCRKPLPNCAVCATAQRASRRCTSAPKPLFWIGGEQLTG